jgi:hypothetical protein
MLGFIFYLKKEPAGSSETSVNIYRAAQHHISKNIYL